MDVLTTTEAWKLDQADDLQLAFATAQNRTIYTANVRDFRVLHVLALAQELSHAGIIVRSNQQMAVGMQIRALLALLAARDAEFMANNLEFLDNWA